MLSILERERAYRRRIAASAALALALQFAAWWLLPSPIGRSLRVSIPRSEAAGLSLYDVTEVGGEPAPAAVTETPELAATPPLEPAIEPVSEPAIVPEPEPAIEAESTPSGGLAPAGAEDASGDGSSRREGATTGAGSGDEDGAAAGSALGIPRVYVYPQVPNRLLVQRKIDDFVLLQVLVAADGRVRDVRVLRAIPNCTECTQSAVEAARQNVYNPPVVPADSAGVWSPPFPMRFSYRR